MAALSCSLRRMAHHLVVRDLRVRPAARGAGAVRGHHAAEPAVVAAEAFDDAGIGDDLEVVRMGDDAHVRRAREGGLLREPVGNPTSGFIAGPFPSRGARPRARRGTPSCADAAAGSTPDAAGSPALRGNRARPAPCARRARCRGSRRDVRIWRIDIEIARRGTSSRRGNQPSPSCWRRQASSSDTTRYGSLVSKSAGGSLKARCPFSPMPTKATSMGWRAMSAPTRAASAFGSGASPSMKWNAPGRTLSTIRSRR